MDIQTSEEAGVIPKCLFSPQIRLSGLIDDNKFIDFQSQLDNALQAEGQFAVELTTPGGDADLARRIGMDIQIAGAKYSLLERPLSTRQALPSWHRSRNSGVISPVIACF